MLAPLIDTLRKGKSERQGCDAALRDMTASAVNTLYELVAHKQFQTTGTLAKDLIATLSPKVFLLVAIEASYA